MILEVDFNSEEALYIQLRNQIIVGIATNRLKEGESLPSVRQLAARASCRNISREEVHALIDEIYEEYGGL